MGVELFTNKNVAKALPRRRCLRSSDRALTYSWQLILADSAALGVN